jgi:hypothetical protein
MRRHQKNGKAIWDNFKNGLRNLSHKSTPRSSALSFIWKSGWKSQSSMIDKMVSVKSVCLLTTSSAHSVKLSNPAIIFVSVHSGTAELIPRLKCSCFGSFGYAVVPLNFRVPRSPRQLCTRRKWKHERPNCTWQSLVFSVPIQDSNSIPFPEFAVYRHFRTRKPCICGAHSLKRGEIHRYMN